MALNVHDSALLASYASTFLFGIYLIIGVECSTLLYQRYKAGRGHTYLASTHVLLLVLVSTRCLAIAERAMNAYKYANVSRGVIDMGGYVSSSPMSLLVCTLYVLVVFIYDAFLIFRTFVVWNSSFIVIVIPVLVSVADLGSAIWWIYLSARFTDISTNLVTALTVFFSLTSLVNVVCSGLIAYRILRVTHRTSDLKTVDSFTRIVALVVESAVATTIVSLCIIITFVVQSFLSCIFTDISAPTIGIVFCSIVIRVSQGRSQGDSIRAISNESCWNSRYNEDPESRTSISNVNSHLGRAVHTTENRGEDLNIHRSTSKIALPELPVFETAVVKDEAY